MFEFLLHFFVIPGVVQWVMKKTEWTSTRRIALSVAFLAAYGLVSVWSDIQAMSTNHYTVLGVPVDCTATDLRKAYKTMSLKYHPDKYAGEDAEERFTEIRHAFEVLSDSRTRRAYDLWGQEDADAMDDSSKSMAVGQYYVMMAIITYLLTMSRSEQSGRTYSFGALAVLLAYELSIRLAGGKAMRIWQFTPSEQISVLHQLFPPFLHGARVMSSVLYRDVELELQQRIFQVYQMQALCVREIVHLRTAFAAMVTARGGGGGGGGGPAAARAQAEAVAALQHAAVAAVTEGAVQPATMVGTARRATASGVGAGAGAAAAKRRGKLEKEDGAPQAQGPAGEAPAQAPDGAAAAPLAPPPLVEGLPPGIMVAPMQPPAPRREWTPLVIFGGLIVLKWYLGS